MSTPSGFEGRYFHLCGSASRKTNADTIRYAHDLIAELTKSIVRGGGGVIVQLGKEPRQVEGDLNSPALLFDWLALQAAADAIGTDGTLSGQPNPPIIAALSEKSEREIPVERQELFQHLLRQGLVQLEYIQPGARSGAMIRAIQSRLGDIAICLGGGTGIEHIASSYLFQRKTVIPFDLPLGASREDGTGGSERLNSDAKAHPSEFLKLRADQISQGASLLARIATKGGQAPIPNITEGFRSIVGAIDLPVAFYVRLLNPTLPVFVAVEKFFREVVDPVVHGIGFRRIEIGTDPAQAGFMNLDIFQGLHFCSVAIVDITGERPNCFIELGYALGRKRRVIVTAMKGTPLPFDQQAVPCFFWNSDIPSAELRQSFTEFIKKYLNRPPLVV